MQISGGRSCFALPVISSARVYFRLPSRILGFLLPYAFRFRTRIWALYKLAIFAELYSFNSARALRHSVYRVSISSFDTLMMPHAFPRRTNISPYDISRPPRFRAAAAFRRRIFTAAPLCPYRRIYLEQLIISYIHYNLDTYFIYTEFLDICFCASHCAHSFAALLAWHIDLIYISREIAFQYALRDAHLLMHAYAYSYLLTYFMCLYSFLRHSNDLPIILISIATLL